MEWGKHVSRIGFGTPHDRASDPVAIEVLSPPGEPVTMPPVKGVVAELNFVGDWSLATTKLT
jgi:hypothetical protein